MSHVDTGLNLNGPLLSYQRNHVHTATDLSRIGWPFTHELSGACCCLPCLKERGEQWGGDVKIQFLQKLHPLCNLGCRRNCHPIWTLETKLALWLMEMMPSVSLWVAFFFFLVGILAHVKNPISFWGLPFNFPACLSHTEPTHHLFFDISAWKYHLAFQITCCGWARRAGGHSWLTFSMILTETPATWDLVKFPLLG